MLETTALIALGLIGIALYSWSFDGRATRRSMATGRASMDVLSDYLGHFNVAEIEATVGSPDEDWQYDTSSWRRLRRTWAVRIFDNPVSDVVTISVALSGVVSQSWTLVLFPFVWFGLALAAMALTQRRNLRREGELSECILIPIGSTLESAQRAWGPYEEQVPEDDSSSDEQVFVFELTSSVGAQVTLFRGKIHRITYATTNKNPTQDLARILLAYGSKGSWTEMTPGYSYRRKDGEILVWCSAMPWTTVVSGAYWSHTSERNQHS